MLLKIWKIDWYRRQASLGPRRKTSTAVARSISKKSAGKQPQQKRECFQRPLPTMLQEIIQIFTKNSCRYSGERWGSPNGVFFFLQLQNYMMLYLFEPLAVETERSGHSNLPCTNIRIEFVATSLARRFPWSRPRIVHRYRDGDQFSAQPADLIDLPTTSICQSVSIYLSINKLLDPKKSE